ncbi:PREDICTED: uncharacterized protein LOC104801437 isoform X2 [Tarenaya hassleriana]|uniref:uncharacterized protein LOC104801437 isoform X2 n=1 Tax=Tarenaya hassleriana TaxID=28532 RepID=UPI00053C13E1|nr:PREDICTED: uncharacterized protein LOC104801437 isoform X2 [Tarenaya hassleriana]
MAKKIQRRAARHERDQLGCMSGFISMFNFRHGRYAHKLLVDRRDGTKRVSGKNTGNPRNDEPDKPECCDKGSQETVVGGERNVTITVIKPSVKKLIEQELFIDREIKERDNCEGQVSDSEIESCRRKNQRRINKTRGKSCSNFGHINVFDNAELDVSCSNQKHRQSMSSLDIDNMIEEFCCEIHHRNRSRMKKKKLNQSHEDYKERLRELVKFLISQKLLHGTRPREDSEILTSKDLMEVFQILGSDEELFLKLLQDPDLLVPRDVQDLQNRQSDKEEENPTLFEKSNASEQSNSPAGKKQSSLFRLKDRQERFNHNECESSERIIILKPGPASLLSPERENNHSPPPGPTLMRNKVQNERISSHFFLSEIKRKLKQAIRKEHQVPPRDGRSGEGFRKSVPTKDHFFIERMARPSMTEKKPPKVLQKHEKVDKKQRVSNIYIEAKKHLSEMLNNGDPDPTSTNKQIQRTLGRILSLPEYLSPHGSPGRRQKQISSTVHRRSASADFPSVEGNKKESYESPPGHAMENAELQLHHFNNPDSCIESLQPATSELTEENVDKEDETQMEDKISSEDVIIDEEIERTPEEEDANSSVLSGQDSPSMYKSNQIVDGIFIVEDHGGLKECEISKQACLEESQPPGSSSVESLSNSLAKTEEPKSSALDLPEWSSPVSVLEPLFVEDDISPARMRSCSGEALVQPYCIQFEENDSAAGNQENCVKTVKDDKDLVFKYVKAVLDAVDSDWEELYLKSQTSDQLLEPVLISNVLFYPNQLCSDHELLFDCINEVLLDFCSCPPWVSFYKPRTRVFSSVKSIIHEVQEAVYWNLLQLPLPRALEQIVRKDMARAGNWLDTREDTDSIGTETGELILNELLEELILNCMNTDETLVLAEVKDDESVLPVP